LPSARVFFEYNTTLHSLCSPFISGRSIFPLTFLRRGKIELHYSNLQKELCTTCPFWPTRSILAGPFILVKIHFITMPSFEPYELFWRRRVWRHDPQGSFRLGLRACPWALYSRSRYANAWYCSGPRNRPRCPWRLEVIAESAPGCMCLLSSCDSVPVFHCSEGSTAMF
jgi:hypothetical protein